MNDAQVSNNTTTKEEDLLEVPSATAAKNRYPPGSIVLFYRPTTSSLVLARVEKIMIDLSPTSSKDFLYRILRMNRNNSNGEQCSAIVARESELQLGRSCPVWAKGHGQEEEISAVVLGSVVQDQQIFYSVQVDERDVQYHGLSASRVRFRPEGGDQEVRCVSTSDSQQKRSAPSTEATAPTKDQPAAKRAKQTTLPDEVHTTAVTANGGVLLPLNSKQPSTVSASSDSHSNSSIANATNSSNTTPTAVPIDAAPSLLMATLPPVVPEPPLTLSASSTTTTAQPMPPEQSIMQKSSNPASAFVWKLMIPPTMNPQLVKHTLIGEFGEIVRDLEERFHCSISFRGFPILHSKPNEPLRVLVKGPRDQVKACISRMEELLMENTPGLDRARMLYLLAKANPHHVKVEGQAVHQRDPMALSRRVWMFVMDIPSHARDYLGIFIGRNGSSLREMERKSRNCSIVVKQGSVIYVLVVSRADARDCNDCARMVQEKMRWAKGKHLESLAQGTWDLM